MHAHQYPWRLQLLRQRASGQPATARVKLRQHGTRHDRRNQVRTTPTTTTHFIPIVFGLRSGANLK